MHELEPSCRQCRVDAQELQSPTTRLVRSGRWSKRGLPLIISPFDSGGIQVALKGNNVWLSGPQILNCPRPPR